MKRSTLRNLSYIGTGVIALDRLRTAFKSRKATDYLIAGGISAGLALQIIDDRDREQMQISADISGRTAGMGSFAGFGSSVASATASAQPGIWSQVGTAFLNIGTNVGSTALGAWASKEISGDGGGGGGGVQYIAPPVDYRNQSGGMSTGSIVALAAAGVGVLGLAIILSRR